MAENDALIERLDRMEESGMAKTNEWKVMWQDNLHYFFSDQLKGKKQHKDWEWITVNYLWPSAMQEIAKLSKIEPKIICNGVEESDVDYADIWQGILQHQWEKGLNKTGMRQEQVRALLDGKLFGYWISKIYWDPKPRRSWDDRQKRWIGDVRHRLWHPAEFWAGDDEKIDDGPCGTVRYVSLDYALHRWPQHKKALEEEAGKFRESNAGNEHIRGQIASAGTYPASGYGGVDRGVGSNGPAAMLNLILKSSKMSAGHDLSNSDVKYVKLSETYFYDDTDAKEKQERDVPASMLAQAGKIYEQDGEIYDSKTRQLMRAEDWPQETVAEWRQPKYPNGRYVLRAGDTILNPEEDSQKWPYSRWPFIVMPHYLLPHMWQGLDGVQMYQSAQDMINVTISHLVNNLKQFGDPKLLVESGAIASPPGRHKEHFRIGKGAGSIIRLVRGAIGGNKVKVLDPPPPSQGATQLYGIFAQEFKNLQGLQSTAKGEKEPGEMTATQAQHLVMSSFDRIYLQGLTQKQWVTEIASLVAEIDQMHYDVGRMVKIVGDDRMEGVQQITQGAKDFKFDVDIEAGSALPFDDEKRMVQYQSAYAMMAEPVVNPMLPEMLRILQIPNWQKLLQRHEPWQQYQFIARLYEQVRTGEIEAEEALSVLIARVEKMLRGDEDATPRLAKEREKERREIEQEVRKEEEMKRAAMELKFLAKEAKAAQQKKTESKGR